MAARARRRTRSAPVVLKFGGYALQYPGAIAERVRRVARDGPVVVVASARRGITDLLESALRSPRPSPDGLVARLRRLHPGPGGGLVAELERAREWLQRPEPGTEPAVARAERVRSIGERLAVRWLVGELDRRGIPAESLDADRIHLTVTGPAERGRILVTHSGPAIRGSVDHVWSEGRVPVLTGYFGRAKDGTVRTLGRGGSDYTATAVAQMLGASRVELVKPSAALRFARAGLPATRSSILRVSYGAAESIARSGPSLIHPRTVAPARAGRFRILISPLRASNGPGILIGRADDRIGRADPRRAANRSRADGAGGSLIGGSQTRSSGTGGSNAVPRRPGRDSRR